MFEYILSGRDDRMKNKKTATIAFGGIIIIVALVCVVVNVTKGKNNDNNTTFSSEVAASEENSSGEATDEQTEVVDNTTATDDSNSDAALKFYNIGDRIPLVFPEMGDIKDYEIEVVINSIKKVDEPSKGVYLFDYIRDIYEGYRQDGQDNYMLVEANITIYNKDENIELFNTGMFGFRDYIIDDTEYTDYRNERDSYDVIGYSLDDDASDKDSLFISIQPRTQINITLAYLIEKEELENGIFDINPTGNMKFDNYRRRLHATIEE